MGYLNYIKISILEEDYYKLINQKIKCKEYIYDFLSDAEKSGYIVNNKKGILLTWLAYEGYNEEIEKDILDTLSKLENGYIFYQYGDMEEDWNFLNRAKTKEIEKPFENLIKYLKDKINGKYEEEEEEFE